MTAVWLEGTVCSAAIRKHAGFIAAGDGVILLGTWLLGIPVLNLFSGLELDAYLADLLILVAGGPVYGRGSPAFSGDHNYASPNSGVWHLYCGTAVSAALDLLLIRQSGSVGRVDRLYDTDDAACDQPVCGLCDWIQKDKKPA